MNLEKYESELRHKWLEKDELVKKHRDVLFKISNLEQLRDNLQSQIEQYDAVIKKAHKQWLELSEKDTQK